MKLAELLPGKQEPSLSTFAPAGPRPPQALHRILICGGGAGGLELAARLGDGPGRSRRTEIVLVDPSPTHLWKPLLHEVAAGTLGPDRNELDFLQQARRHGFRFHLGALRAVDRGRQEIWLDALADEEGNEIAPRRALWYDTLVLAVGSMVNDFGTPGVRQYALTLDSAEEAQHFHRRLLALCARAELQDPRPIPLVIVGGGATGVELAAELVEAVGEIASYGSRLRRLPQPVQICLVENGPRLLAALPEAVAAKAHADLVAHGIEVRLQQRVVEVKRDRVAVTGAQGREEIPSAITVWAAGIRAPDFLAGLDGLETGRLNQLVVRPTLQTSRDDNIFALGDCASCVLDPNRPPVPPTAQAASQEARFLARSLTRRLAGEPLLPFAFHDRGALVSLGRHDAVGSLKEETKGRNLFVEGLLARFSYWALYRRHLAMLLGLTRTAISTLGGWLAGRSQPRVKLH